jgi:hypothetical protein
VNLVDEASTLRSASGCRRIRASSRAPSAAFGSSSSPPTATWPSRGFPRGPALSSTTSAIDTNFREPGRWNFGPQHALRGGSGRRAPALLQWRGLAAAAEADPFDAGPAIAAGRVRPVSRSTRRGASSCRLSTRTAATSRRRSASWSTSSRPGPAARRARSATGSDRFTTRKRSSSRPAEHHRPRHIGCNGSSGTERRRLAGTGGCGQALTTTKPVFRAVRQTPPAWWHNPRHTSL